MDAQVLQLFRENHIPQVRDKLLEVTQDLAKNDVLLNKNLKLHFGDILTITESVHEMYLELQDDDAHFRQLCFDDDKYQLGRLPDFEEPLRNNESNHSKSMVNVDESSTEGGYDDDEDDDTELLLVVSQWSLAVSKFVSAVNGSATVSSSIFDELFTKFNQLVEYQGEVSFKDTNFKYYKSVVDKLLFLQSDLIENANIIMLNHLQWIQIYDLINDTTKTNLPWDEKLIVQLNDIIMDKVIRLVLSSTGDDSKNKIEFSNNDRIKNFINSSQFNERILAHIKEKTRSNLNELKENLKIKVMDEFKVQEVSHRELDDLSVLIAESKLDSLGLISKNSRQIYDLVEPTIQMIQDLIKYNCDPTSVKEIQTEMIELLSNQCLSEMDENSSTTPTVATTERQANDTSNLINGFVTTYHKSNLTRLIKSHIQRLQDISP
ncbi:conserved oligomeric Golgi complex subunit 1 [Monosporozyma servazzii]